MIKVLVVIALCLVAVGCSGYIPSPMDKRKAAYLCKEEAGVYQISSFTGIQCNTGKVFSWNVVGSQIMSVEYVNQLGENK